MATHVRTCESLAHRHGRTWIRAYKQYGSRSKHNTWQKAHKSKQGIANNLIPACENKTLALA